MKQTSDHSKSHKSRKTADQPPGKPRQRTSLPEQTPQDGLPPPISATATPTRPPENEIVTALVKTEDTPDQRDTIPAPLAAKKQWWFRQPNSKTRKVAEKIAVLDAAGHPDAVIAKRLKTTELTVRQTRYLAKKNGWWDENDEAIDLEAELAMNIDRKIVRNIDAALDGSMTNWQTHEMTIAAAKGRGVFKTHEKSESANTLMMPVAIQIVMPPVGTSDQQMDIPDDMVGGTPSYIEGEIDVE